MDVMITPIPNEYAIIKFLYIRTKTINKKNNDKITEKYLYTFFSLIDSFFLLLSIGEKIQINIVKTINIPKNNI